MTTVHWTRGDALDRGTAVWMHVLQVAGQTFDHGSTYLNPLNLPPVAQPKDGWYAQNGELVKIVGGAVVFTISAPHLLHLLKFLWEVLEKLFEK